MFGALRHRSTNQGNNGDSGAAGEVDIEMDTIHINHGSTGASDDNKLPSSSSPNDQSSIIDAVKLDILGAPHSGWRQFFYMLDPYKQGKKYLSLVSLVSCSVISQTLS